METLRNQVNNEISMKFEERQKHILKKYVKENKGSKIKIK